MNYMPKIDRRSFLVGTAAVGGGLSLGFALPFGADTARAQSGTPEIERLGGRSARTTRS